ncbi:UNVERIFIED_CONTAM: hypothetical protein K2H54_028129 [Gekko kuhli]
MEERGGKDNGFVPERTAILYPNFVARHLQRGRRNSMHSIAAVAIVVEHPSYHTPIHFMDTLHCPPTHPSSSPSILLAYTLHVCGSLFLQHVFLSSAVTDRKLCQFTAPVPHLAVYTGTSDHPSPSKPFPPSCHALRELPLQCPEHITLPNSPSCPSPISVPLESTLAMDRNWDTNGTSSNPIPTINEGTEISMDSESGTCSLDPVSSESKLPPKSRVNLSLSRFLKRGCLNSQAFATLPPKCSAMTNGKVQPSDDLKQDLQQKHKKMSK